MISSTITMRQRADVVLAACGVAFTNAEIAWRSGMAEDRQLWIGIQCACGEELQDVVAALKAGVP
jgi:hypothetical protein